jgi:hypothetical protein
MAAPREKKMKLKLALGLFCLLLISCAAQGQGPHASVEPLKAAAAKLSTAEDINFVAGLNVEVAAIRCINEVTPYTGKFTDFMKYVTARTSPGAVVDKTVPRMALIDELAMVTPAVRKAISFLQACSKVVPAEEKRKEFVDFAQLMKLSVEGQTGALAEFYALSSTLRYTDVVLKESAAVLAKTKYDPSADVPTLKLAIADLDEAIALAPKKDLYVNRAKLHKRLGNTAAADADTKKAATMN